MGYLHDVETRLLNREVVYVIGPSDFCRFDKPRFCAGARRYALSSSDPEGKKNVETVPPRPNGRVIKPGTANSLHPYISMHNVDQLAMTHLYTCQIVVVTNENASRHSIDCILVYIMSDRNERIYRQNRGRIGGKVT